MIFNEKATKISRNFMKRNLRKYINFSKKLQKKNQYIMDF